GGQVYELRQDGTLILIDSGNVGSVRIDAPGYGNKTGASFAITGTIDIKGEQVGEGIGSGYTLRGTGANFDLFKFMSDNSDVEYALLYNSKTGQGTFSTTQEQMAVSNIEIPGDKEYGKYDTFYHNHPAIHDSKYYSEKDAITTDALAEKGLKKSILYNEDTGKTSTYWDNKYGYDNSLYAGDDPW
ncbi:MAG: JAB-like toxin 1 domain-containing protein, partial [Bacteroidaceae bacterium]